MTALDGLKVGVLVFAAAVLQASLFGALDVAGGRPDLLLLAVIAVALVRGTIVGAAAGFFGGLVVDLATFETLGVTSLLLTLAGYWIGRYGETTGRDRAHAPLLSVFVMTVGYGVGGYVLHTILGDTVSARVALGTPLLAAVIVNLVLAVPIYALVRRVLRQPERYDRAREVTLLGQ
ncbi:MAG: rod shape-determining protein MreD [Gaiellaceae bacterium]